MSQSFEAHQTQRPIELYADRQEELIELFYIVGIREPTNLSDAVDRTQPWIRGDHVRPEHRLQVPSDQIDRVYEIFDDFGMVAERPLASGSYDEILVLGGMHVGNNRRLEYLHRHLEMGVRTPHIRLLGGQRPLDFELEEAKIKENFAELEQRPVIDPWLARRLNGSDELKWETDLIRLASSARLGEMSLHQFHLRLADADPVDHYEFTLADGQAVSLLHTPAVERPNGQRRHTSEACIVDWLHTYEPEQGAHIGLIVGNPHIDRIAMSVRQVLERKGRSDIVLYPAGSEASPTLQPQIYFGEIARRLYEESKLHT